MRDLWDSLPLWLQDAASVLALLAPLLVLGLWLLRGFAPWPLVRALLARFRWTNALFVGLIAVSVAMGIGLLAQERGLRAASARAADKFSLVVAAPGSEMTLLLATVFLQPSDVALLDGETFRRIAETESVEIAAPLAFGDSYRGAPVVGTVADFVLYLSDGQIEGRLWADHGEAVIGASVALEIGEGFSPAHGHGAGAEEGAHAHSQLRVVGRMAPTGTPWDRAVLIPVEAVWEVHGLANGHAPGDDEALGPPFDPAYFPGTPAVVVKASALWANYALRDSFTETGRSMAFFPATVLTQLYAVMGDVRQAMSVMAAVTQVLVAGSVLAGLLILTRLFRRQIAMLRALGAPRRFVLAVV
uniref:hypothetical protein n=1 Tax=Oceanicola sp. S124 TaxID=1042378 RepID=UPI0002558227